MRPILESLAIQIAESHPAHMEEVRVILPNRRSGVFLQKYLAKHRKKAGWAPQISSIEDFINEISLLDQADPVELLFISYDRYRGMVPSPEPFDEYFHWGEVMLRDFDEIDKYLVNASQLFTNVMDLKKLEEPFAGLEEAQLRFIRQFWEGFYNGDRTPEKVQFLDTWKRLPLLYEELKRELKSRNLGYPGMQYREIVERIERGRMDPPAGQSIIVAGFNALNSCEERIFSWLQTHGAQFYWDYDCSYTDREDQEAGRFLRKHMVRFPPPARIDSFRGLELDKEIRILDMPTDVLQAKCVHLLLEEEEPGIEPDSTDIALVLCDEELLMPVLTSLPESIGEVNVTMGYPLKGTPAFNLVDLLFRLQSNRRGKQDGKISFYHRQLSDILLHPLVRPLTAPSIHPFLEEISRTNLIWVDRTMLQGNLEQLIFRPVDGSASMLEYLRKILRWIMDHEDQTSEYPLQEYDRGGLLQLLVLLHKVEAWLLDRPDLPVKTMERLFRRMVVSTRIPFEGEPLTGLQIMGILETRLLDFRRVIMLSMNEEVMPASSQGQSYIPYTLRLAFGMPSREDMDAIYAYYFHRLLQRAGKVDLLFNSSSEGVRTGEMSRYLYQLIFERDLKVERPGFTVEARQPVRVTIPHTPAVDQALDRFLAQTAGEDARYLSASAINAYIDCPLRFYFRYLAGIGEPEQVEEEIGPADFGTVVHEAICILYKEITGREGGKIHKSRLKELLESGRSREVLREVFAKVHHRGRIEEVEGRNIIAFSVMQRFLEKIIATDIELAPFDLISTERTYQKELEISVGGGFGQVMIGGKIDRVDRVDESVRVIDYKTGDARSNFPDVGSLFDPRLKSRNRAALQAMLYAWLVSDAFPREPVMPGLYVIKALYGKTFDPGLTAGTSSGKIPVKSFADWQDEYLEHLKKTVARIFNPEVPFGQTDQEARCRNCDFARICERDPPDDRPG